MQLDVVAFILGSFTVMWVDVFWWQIDYKKMEKGLEWHEHYHLGLELMIVGLFVGILNDFASSFIFGAGFLFLAAEWRQAIEVVRNKVEPGHPFAYGSTHFVSSTIVGAILLAITIISYIYLVDMVKALL